MKLGWFVLGLALGVASTFYVMTRWMAPVPAVDIVARATPDPSPVAPPAGPDAAPSETLPPVDFSTASPETSPAASPFLEPPVPPVVTTVPAGSPPRSFAPPAETGIVQLPILKTDIDRLRARGLRLPVRGMEPRAIADTYGEARGERVHQAIDLLAPRGTPVVAVEDGHIQRLFTSQRGGLTIYQFDPQSEYCYYYAHLDRYATGLKQGMAVRKGDVIGHVGTSGNASPNTPHLHFSIIRLGPEKRWWEGTAVNPYPLWAPTAPAATAANPAPRSGG